jgi:putative hydrolase of the HAD superfamily
VNDSTRAVLFDFDGTLVFYEPDSSDLVSAFCADIGQPLSAEAERRGRRIRHRYFVDPAIRDQLDGMPPEQFWLHYHRYLLDSVGVHGDLDRLAQKMTERNTDLEVTYHCPEAGRRTLAELRDRGFRLGLITNRSNPERFYELLDRMDLRDSFDMVLASGEVGVSKPEPGIFEAALDELGVEAGESVYVGDNYWADVVGAQRAGVAPILLDPRGLFPEADCLIVERIEDVMSYLPQQAAD